MSLFANLRSLYRTERFLHEDPHTEIVAAVLRHHPALAVGWLRSIKATNLTQPSVTIRTQERFPALPGHDCASRPDMVIRLAEGTQRELLFVESKLPASQGDTQLQRYADHLAAQHGEGGYHRATLVFITQYFELADRPVVQGRAVQPDFVATRWHRFFPLLKAHDGDDGLALELVEFMNEQNMSVGNIFRAADIIALENYHSARSLMDEVLEEVRRYATPSLGWIPDVKKASEQLRDEGRYAIYTGNWNDFACFFGFWVPSVGTNDPVSVGVKIYRNPKSPVERQIRDAFKQWIGESPGWNEWNLDHDTEWASIEKGKPIHELMAGSDHVAAMKSYLCSLVDEVACFRKDFPDLPWQPV